MRITFVLADGFTLAGGQRVIAVLAKELLARGHSVHVVASAPRPLGWRERWRTGQLLRVPASPSYFDGLEIPKRCLTRHRPVTDADVPDADVVIATWWETAEWVARLSPAKGRKVHLIQHHEVFDYLPIERVRAVYRLPFHKIVSAPWLREVMRREYGAVDARVVTNGVDMQQFHAPARSKQPVPSVGVLYSPIAWKGWDVSVGAVAQARRVLPDLRLIVIGEYVPPRHALPAASEFHRRPRQEALREIYARCDVWLCGSWAEGFHLPILEAMACRCPVVSTRVGGSQDVIEEGVNGYLVAPGDSAALGERLVDVLQRADIDWRMLSDAALATATSHSWQKSADDLVAALQDVVRQG